MPQEQIVISSSENDVIKTTAEVERYSQTNRVLRASAYVAAGLLGGTVCIVIPLVHLITTWGLPALGIYMAYRTMQREVVLKAIEAACPNCKETIQLTGGGLNDHHWQVCHNCHARLHIAVQPSAVVPPGSSRA
jgi:hypothetical protein